MTQPSKMLRAKRVKRRLSALVAAGTGLARNPTTIPPGHYSSPIQAKADRVTAVRLLNGRAMPKWLSGIDLRPAEQFALLRELAAFYSALPFSPHRTSDLRFFYEN